MTKDARDDSTSSFGVDFLNKIFTILERQRENADTVSAIVMHVLRSLEESRNEVASLLISEGYSDAPV